MASNNNMFNKKLVIPSGTSPDHVVFRKNGLIPSPSNHSNDGLGRETMYEPFLAFSPVYASQRLSHLGDSDNDNNDKMEQRKRLVTGDEMEELTKHLDTLLIAAGRDGGDDETTTSKTNSSSVQEEKDRPTKKKVAFVDDKDDNATYPTTGRYQSKAFSKKANGEVTVKRSARLALACPM